MFTIAVITIGQSPRPDITSDLRKLLPEGVCMTEYGALDGLTRQQAEEQFGYRGRGELLITRMGGSGSSLKVDGDSIMGQLQTCICRAQEDGADAALIACTGVFPDYEHQIPLLLPGEAQRKATMNLAGEQLMGVVIPKEHQREQIAGWWRESGARHILFGIADPYEDPKKIVEAALELKAAGARVLCLDCFGYTTRQQADVQKATGLETVLPRTVLIEELTALRNITPKDSADAR